VSVLVVTGTGTDVGKTVAAAALAACASGRVAVVKPAQTGLQPDEAGDLAEIAKLSRVEDGYEYVRYPDPLSPHHAAALSGLPTLAREDAAARIAALAAEHDTVIVEGAGGVLVPFDATSRWTVLDLARDLAAEIVLVTRAGLGTLSDTQLAVDRIAAAGTAPDVVIGLWPARPGLAARCNLDDLAAMSRTGHLAGVLPAGMTAVTDFPNEARASLGPGFGGTFDDVAFRAEHRPEPRP
jgi:dethiobiotin synthetase